MPARQKKLTSALRVKRQKPKGKGKVLSPISARIIERQNAVFQMRRDGFTHIEIASVLGVHLNTVRDDLKVVLGRMVAETRDSAEEYRVLEDAKYQSIQKSFMPYTRERKVKYVDPRTKKEAERVLPPDATAAQVVMTASAHKRKMLALDIPEVKRLEVSAIREYKGVDMDKV